MTFLEIAKRIRQECGINGTGPTSIVLQTGELKQVVDWMTSAYEDVQSAHPGWMFLRDDFLFNCEDGKGEYTPAECNAPDMGEWSLDSFRCWSSPGDEQYLPWVTWETMRDTWKIGEQRTRKGRPMCFSVKPDDSITFDCVPDSSYTVTGEYSRLPVEIGGNSDIPIFPVKFHHVIVWRAVMMYATYAAEADKYTAAYDEYTRILRRMTATLLPDIDPGPPLA